MNRNALRMIGLIFVLLMVGLYFSAVGFNLPFVRQVSNAEASTVDLTDDKVWMLLALIVVVLANLGIMAVGLYVVMWYLNREVNRVNQQPAEPFNLLSTGSDGSTAGAAITNNALWMVIGMGVLMVIATILALLLA